MCIRDRALPITLDGSISGAVLIFRTSVLMHTPVSYTHLVPVPNGAINGLPHSGHLKGIGAVYPQ